MIDHHFRIQQSVMERKRESFLKHAANYNARMHIKDFQPGDIVFYVHNTTGHMFKKFQIKYDGPARILSKESDGNYKIENILTGRRFLIHANRLKPGSAEDQLFRRPLSKGPCNTTQEQGDDDEAESESGAAAATASPAPRLEQDPSREEVQGPAPASGPMTRSKEDVKSWSGPITRARSRAHHDARVGGAQGTGLNKVMVMNQNHYWDQLRHVSQG